jgi:hypothetical protein
MSDIDAFGGSDSESHYMAGKPTPASVPVGGEVEEHVAYMRRNVVTLNAIGMSEAAGRCQAMIEVLTTQSRALAAANARIGQLARECEAWRAVDDVAHHRYADGERHAVGVARDARSSTGEITEQEKKQ